MSAGRSTEETKTEQYRIRLTKTESEMLRFCVEETGKSKADIFRIGLKKIYSHLKEKK